MRSLLLAALTGAMLLAGGLSAPVAGAARVGDAYETRAVARIQQARADRGLQPLRTAGTRAGCLDRRAERWSRRPGTDLDLGRVASACGVASVKSLRYVSAAGPRRQVAAILRGQETGRTLLTRTGRVALGFGHTRVARGHSVAILLAPLTVPSTVDTEQSRYDVVALTNAERTAHGLTALTADACLMALAQRHAEHLAAVRRLEHQDPAAVAAACDVRGGVGENVLNDPDGSGARLVAQWMASAEHREILLSGTFGLVGVGVAHDPATGMYYAVQLLAGHR
jgi:uncharacterized protein YkwD